MGVQLSASVLKSPRGLMKILCLCLVIIVLVLARTGFSYGRNEVTHIVDAKWVTICCVTAYTFLYAIIIITYILGDDVSLKMESMLQFLGCILFLTSGSLVVDKYQSIPGDDGDVGLALGSMAIITGFFMFFDFLIIIKDILSKK